MTDSYEIAREVKKRAASYSERPVPDRWQLHDYLDAIAVCAEDLGHTPSYKNYMRWRSEQSDASVYPSAARITQIFQRWNNAIAKAGLEPNPGTNPGHSQQFSYDDCIKALHACVDDLGRLPTYDQYDEWARESTGIFPSGPTLRNRVASRWLEIIHLAFS